MKLTKKAVVFFAVAIAALVVASSATSTAAEAAADQICLSLTNYYTAGLTNSINSPEYVKENNLAALPVGRQVLGQVPFEICGVVQLDGKKIREWNRTEFPAAVNGIVVGRTFGKLHLLHGAGGVYDDDGTTIGTLVLHYADDSKHTIDIKNGEHVRDWWGDAQQPITGTNSVLAWTGTNPALKKYGGEKPGALRLYRSTFTNPQPQKLVKAIDFKSAMQNSSPFLLGITLE
jgi:hypothetical protein